MSLYYRKIKYGEFHVSCNEFYNMFDMNSLLVLENKSLSNIACPVYYYVIIFVLVISLYLKSLIVCNVEITGILPIFSCIWHIEFTKTLSLSRLPYTTLISKLFVLFNQYIYWYYTCLNFNVMFKEQKLAI